MMGDSVMQFPGDQGLKQSNIVEINDYDSV